MRKKDCSISQGEKNKMGNKYGQSTLVVESSFRASQLPNRRDHGKHTEQHIGDIHYNLPAIISIP